MKQFKFLSIAVATALAMGSCADHNLDGPNGNGSVEAKDGAYMSIRIDLPDAGRYSRSTTGEPGNDGSTSNTGVEIGQDYENYVGEVIVVLATNPSNPTESNPTNGFIAAATVDASNAKPVAADKASYQLLSSLSLNTLQNFYNAMAAASETDFRCNVYVFANPGAAIKNIIFGVGGTPDTPGTSAPTLLSNTWINSIVSLQNVPTQNIANKGGNEGKGSFLMSNATMAVRNLPTSINDWKYYTTEANPFDLSGDNNEILIDNGEDGEGPVKIERAAARFDFRDGSPLAPTSPFTYHVVYEGDASQPIAERTPIIDIKLINMSLVNVNKMFYAVRRVSTTGSPTPSASNTVTICGAEKPWTANANGSFTGGNYVVDANYLWKTTLVADYNDDNPPTTVNYASNFFYPFFTNDEKVNMPTASSNWFTSYCDEVITGTNDNPNSWNTGNPAPYPGYHIWTYATENTIAPASSQKNGISTGVVFKGKMVATEAATKSDNPETKALAEAINATTENNKRLFTFAGNLYLEWKGIRDAAIKQAVSGIKWVLDDPDAATPDYDKGHWEFTSIDRSSSLYIAVFGNGGFGTVQFTYNIVDESGAITATHTGTITDTLPVSPDCADAKWTAWETGGKTTAQLNAAKAATVAAKITIYEQSNDGDAHGGWGYYCYYYYWNRHNNMGTNVDSNGTMNPMEFAVVRNNVYKLAVTNIKQLGHPRNSDNDPNRPTGNTDDETQDVYLTVTAEVLPWVVRLNDIEF